MLMKKEAITPKTSNVLGLNGKDCGAFIMIFIWVFLYTTQYTASEERISERFADHIL